MNLFELRNDKTKEVTAQLEKAIEIAMGAVGMEAEGDVKEITPVGTPESTGIPYYVGGNLRNSIAHQYSKEEQAEYIGTVVEYAPYVELGTSKMKARSYLKRGITENIEKYKEILADYISANMEK